jgi:hypothetical protein
MKVVTVEKLKKLGACASARRLFIKTFGQSAKITAANLTKAEKAGLSLFWLLEELGLAPHHEGAMSSCKGCKAERIDNYERKALLKLARG